MNTILFHKKFENVKPKELKNSNQQQTMVAERLLILLLLIYCLFLAIVAIWLHADN